jgi:hypothetical protein
MKLLVKTLRCFTILLLIQQASFSQSHFFSGRSNDISTDIKRVISDYPNQFKNITGELIVQNPQSADYQCSLKINGAEECIITKYSSIKKEIYSWQAIMLTTENFNEAKRKFRSFYDQLNNLTINSSQLRGRYEAPAEEKKFTSVIFSFSPGDESTDKLRVEVVMESEGMDWKIKILLYDRERDDDEKGKVVE